MNVTEFGAGPVVLLLHGTPSPATEWSPLAAVLARGHRVLVPELPGYGTSPNPTVATMEHVGDALAAMLAERNVTQLRAIVGFSSGAYRALDLALRHAVTAELIVTIGGLATLDEPGRAMRRGFADQLAADPAMFDSDAVHAAVREVMFSPAWIARHPAETRVRDWLGCTTAAAFASELAALAGCRDLRPALGGLRSALYARVGAEDACFPPAWSEELVRLTPHAQLEIVAACGHALLVEDATATIEAIRARIENPSVRAH